MSKKLILVDNKKDVHLDLACNLGNILSVKSSAFAIPMEINLLYISFDNTMNYGENRLSYYEKNPGLYTNRKTWSLQECKS